MASIEKKPARVLAHQGGADRETSAGCVSSHSHYKALLARGQIVACLYPDGVLRKRVKGSVHRLRSRPGWALDWEALLQARELGCHSIEIEDSETNTICRATIGVMFLFGVPIDFGHGRQRALDMRYWQVLKAGEYQQAQLPGLAAVPA
jgi:hypothetical protein